MGNGLAYYNEHDPYAAQWLRNLIKAGLIAPGDVDERSIEDVCPDDIRHYTQCHFFAGIGGWSHALRLARWPDSVPVWTGSCPCQPFSAAGKGKGFADERHLWPACFYLIEQCRPAVVFGEQVASKDGLNWLNLVQADLEGAGYATAAADLCAAGVGAPHIRQRLYWAAHGNWAGAPRFGQYGRDSEAPARIWSGSTDSRELGVVGDQQQQGLEECIGDTGIPSRANRTSTGQTVERTSVHAVRMEHDPSDGRQQRRSESSGRSATSRCESGGMADRNGAASGRNTGSFRSAKTSVCGPRDFDGHESIGSGDGGHIGGVVNTNGGNSIAERQQRSGEQRLQPQDSGASELVFGRRPSPTNGFWRDADWLFCRDDKWRPVEPGTFPLDHGVPARVGKLRAYGNAIVPQCGALFVESYLESCANQP